MNEKLLEKIVEKYVRKTCEKIETERLCETIRDAGFEDELIKYVDKFGCAPISLLSVLKDFCKLYPEKLTFVENRYTFQIVMSDIEKEL